MLPEDVLKRLMQGMGDEESENLPGVARQCEVLKDAAERLLQKKSFRTGEYVVQGEFLRTRRFPNPERPAVFIRYLDEKVLMNTENDSIQFFREELDCVIGVLQRAGDDSLCLTEYHVDSRRLETFIPPTTDSTLQG